MASISSSSTGLPPPWQSESNNSTTLRDVSFSSYLNSPEKTYIRSLVESSQNTHDSRQTMSEDEEIDVFTADKYFKGEGVEIDLNNTRKKSTARKHKHDQYKKDHVIQEDIASDDHSTTRLNKVQPQTPSNQSESSSSWNSQSALLRRVQRNPSRGNNNNSGRNNNSSKSNNNSSSKSNNNSNNNHNSKAQGKSSFLACCCQKSAVEVQDDLISSTNGRTRGHSSNVRSINSTVETTDPFVFPTVLLNPGTQKINHSELDQQQEDHDARRKSLDVFGYNEMEDNYMTVERRLNMLSWDAIPRQQNQRPSVEEVTSPASGPPESTESYKDTESDASSDLFEIECLSCNANPVVVGPRQPSDGGCNTPTTCYAPSEASIEWSVVTASAADFSTAVSDPEDQIQRSVVSSVPRRKMTPKTNPSTKRSGMLLGCKSQKAVRVAGEVHRKPAGSREKLEKERRHRYSDSFTAVTRFQAEAKLDGIGQKQISRKEPTVIAPRSPRWSHSSHASELLYLQ